MKIRGFALRLVVPICSGSVFHYHNELKHHLQASNAVLITDIKLLSCSQGNGCQQLLKSLLRLCWTPFSRQLPKAMLALSLIMLPWTLMFMWEGAGGPARHCQHFTAHLDGLLHTCGPADLTLFAVRHIVCLSCLTRLKGRTFAFNKETRQTDWGQRGMMLEEAVHREGHTHTHTQKCNKTNKCSVTCRLLIYINIQSSSPAALYRILGSKNMQGFWSAMQERSSPLAWTGLRGITTWGTHDSLH